MKNYTQRGDVIGVTAPAAVNSGNVVQISDLIGVAAHSAESGEHLELVVTGVFAVPAAAGSPGDTAYWDGAQATTSDGSGANTRMGHFVSTTAGGTAEVRIAL